MTPDDELTLKPITRRVLTWDEAVSCYEVYLTARARERKAADRRSDEDHDGTWRGEWR